MKKINTRIDLVDSNNSELRTIRHRVFIDEQRVPEALEWDKHDASASHFLLCLDTMPVACARLKTDGQVGRMAVLKGYRGQGYGSMLLEHILQTARTAGFRKLYLHAQTSAISFYEKHGFSAHGSEFMDAGIPHREMMISLDATEPGSL